MSRHSSDAGHREIDHTGPNAALLHDCRAMISDALTEIAGVLHVATPLAPGEQWTIDVAMSCGLSGSIVIAPDAQGPCGPCRARISAAPTSIREDGGVIARPNGAGGR